MRPKKLPNTICKYKTPQEKPVKSPWRAKQDSKRFYDETARSYKALYGEEQTAKYHTALRALEPLSGNVLDVGCGPGALLRKIPRARAVGLFVGVDTSIQMLKTARATENDYPHLICADVDFLPLQDGAFGTVFAFTLLQNLPDPLKSLRELGRVVKKEGSVVATFHKSSLTRDEVLSLLSQEYQLLREIETEDEVRDYAFVCRHPRPR